LIYVKFDRQFGRSAAVVECEPPSID